MWFWHSSKKEIEICLESKETKFTKNEYKNTNLTVEDWLQSLLECFLTEFTMDMLIAYSKEESLLFQGYHGKYLNSLNLWIKMPLCKQGVLRLHA